MLPAVERHNRNSGPDTHARIRRMTLDIAPGGRTLKEEHHGQGETTGETVGAQGQKRYTPRRAQDCTRRSARRTEGCTPRSARWTEGCTQSAPQGAEGCAQGTPCRTQGRTPRPARRTESRRGEACRCPPCGRGWIGRNARRGDAQLRSGRASLVNRLFAAACGSGGGNDDGCPLLRSDAAVEEESSRDLHDFRDVPAMALPQAA